MSHLHGQPVAVKADGLVVGLDGDGDCAMEEDGAITASATPTQ
jgi:hypothetical protein